MRGGGVSCLRPQEFGWLSFLLPSCGRLFAKIMLVPMFVALRKVTLKQLSTEEGVCLSIPSIWGCVVSRSVSDPEAWPASAYSLGTLPQQWE